jgi:hypothetical protein
MTARSRYLLGFVLIGWAIGTAFALAQDNQRTVGPTDGYQVERYELDVKEGEFIIPPPLPAGVVEHWRHGELGDGVTLRFIPVYEGLNADGTPRLHTEIFFKARQAGDYEFFQVRENDEGPPDLIHFRVEVAGGDEPPPPPPPPPATGERWVIFVYESGDIPLDGLTVLNSPDLREGLIEKGHKYKDPNTGVDRANLRRIDVDVKDREGRVPELERAWIEAAGSDLPVMIIVDKKGEVVHKGSVPESVDEVLDLVPDMEGG